jgi:hypothetical protein
VTLDSAEHDRAAGALYEVRRRRLRGRPPRGSAMRQRAVGRGPPRKGFRVNAGRRSPSPRPAPSRLPDEADDERTASRPSRDPGGRVGHGSSAKRLPCDTSVCLPRRGRQCSAHRHLGYEASEGLGGPRMLEARGSRKQKRLWGPDGGSPRARRCAARDDGPRGRPWDPLPDRLSRQLLLLGELLDLEPGVPEGQRGARSWRVVGDAHQL